jgi:hypothetical protein
VTDGKDPFFALMEFPHNPEHDGFMAQEFGGASADEHDCLKACRFNLAKGEVALDSVTGPFHVGVPVGLEIVQDRVQPFALRGGNEGSITRFAETMLGIVNL